MDWASKGDGVLAVVEGPLGIGKSRVLGAARELAAARGMLPLRARAAQFESGVPYGVVIQLLSPAIRQLTEDDRREVLAGPAQRAAEVLEGTGPTRGEDVDDVPFATLNSLFWLTVGLAEASDGLVIVVDDLQWTDAESLRYLDFVARRRDGVPLLMVVAVRQSPGDAYGALVERIVGAPSAISLAPRPLSAGALGRWIAGGLGCDPDPRFVAACEQATGGVPLLVGELVRTLAAERIQPIAANANRVSEIGERAAGLSVVRRVALLADEVSTVARFASVLGDPFELDVVRAAARLSTEEVAWAARELATAGVLRSDGEEAFAHPVIREAFRAQLTTAELADTHERLARALHDHGASAMAIASQLIEAPPIVEDWTVEALESAGRWALGSGAPDAAIPYLRRALEVATDERVRMELTVALGGAELRSGDPGFQNRLADALKLTRTCPHLHAEAAGDLAQALWYFGATEESIAVLDRAGQAIRPSEPDLAKRLDAQLLTHGQYGSPAVRSLVADEMERARERLGDPASPGDRAVRAPLAIDAAVTGSAADAVRLAQEALAADEAVHDTMMYGAIVALAWGDALDEAREAALKALAEAQRLGSRAGYASAAAVMAIISLRSGRVLDAESYGRDAFDAALSSSPFVAPCALAPTLLALIERDRISEAESLDPGADLPQSPHNPFEIMLAYARAEVKLASSEPQAALALYDQAEQRWMASNMNPHRGPMAPGVIPWGMGRTRALLALGHVDRAAHQSESDLAVSESFDRPRGLGLAQHASGMTMSGETAIARLTQAVGTLESCEAPIEHADALCDLGAAVRRAKRRAEARPHLRRAAQLGAQLGAERIRLRALAELEATGITVNSHDPYGMAALTPSERRVAAMACEGRTNREIAQSLFITKKTVETHLSHIYSKLSIKGRADLPEALVAHEHED
ncbi:hypothetical protein AYO39_01630 [Actinobacteria bacterium SCGC AG-212-D09]|nr:hypothetical protein AYO39_01630 [Actinobacteria bacterium SCGC AG-212-D09]